MNNTSFSFNIKKFLIFFIILILGQAISPHIRIFGVAPNLIFITIIAATLCEKESGILLYSLIFGLCYDFFNGLTFGIFTLMFFLISLIFGKLYHTYFEDMTTIQTLLFVFASAVYSIAMAVITSNTSANTGFIYLFVRISLIELVYNSVIGIVVINIYKRIIAKKTMSYRGYYGY